MRSVRTGVAALLLGTVRAPVLGTAPGTWQVLHAQLLSEHWKRALGASCCCRGKTGLNWDKSGHREVSSRVIVVQKRGQSCPAKVVLADGFEGDLGHGPQDLEVDQV